MTDRPCSNSPNAGVRGILSVRRQSQQRDRATRAAAGGLRTATWLGPFTAALLALSPPASAVETRSDAFVGLDFDRPLSRHELLRAWHQQTRRRQPTEHQRADKGRASALAIVTVTSERQRPRFRPQPVTGRLAERRARYAALVDAVAGRHGIDPELVHAVIRAESGYHPRAKSPAGACGLMQLMPATARRFGVRDIWDPAQNIEGGVAYLRFLLDRFEHDLQLVLAGYNAGEGAVEKHGNRVPPYRETQTYVRRVLGYLGAV
jgi:soluble lytic murein transglycosylase-like protein